MGEGRRERERRGRPWWVWRKVRLTRFPGGQGREGGGPSCPLPPMPLPCLPFSSSVLSLGAPSTLHLAVNCRIAGPCFSGSQRLAWCPVRVLSRCSINTLRAASALPSPKAGRRGDTATATYQAFEEAPEGLPPLLGSLRGPVPVLQRADLHCGLLRAPRRLLGLLPAALPLVHRRCCLLVLGGALFPLGGRCRGLRLWWRRGGLWRGGLLRGVGCLR